MACLSVMAYHINLIARSTHLWTPARHPILAPILLAGSSGVTLFFVLSGFLLFLPYARSLVAEARWPDARLFYLRRALRILPGYYASLFLLVMLQSPQYLEPRHWKDLALFLLLFMDATPATFQQINGPYWTLAIEWQFYLLLPVIALGIRYIALRARPRRGLMITVLCVLGLIGWDLASQVMGSYLTTHPQATILGPRLCWDALVFVTFGHRGKYLEDFAVGMIIAICAALPSDTLRPTFARWMRRLSPWLCAGGVVLLALMMFQALPHVVALSGPMYAWSNELGFALGFGCCLVSVVFGMPWLRRCLESAPLCWIGVTSYSLYIWHLPLLVTFAAHVAPALASLPPLLAYGSYWLWAMLVVIPFAAAMYVFVEKPGLRLSDRLRGRRGTAILPG
jgi:peptidoglycan/LPS O-acetylase OafA/YrhL